ncbi:MAG: PAS domain-containing protein, partial [Anaerolineales bacterium]|nr:PAS domain-containing protein [Anaerolineales bacterium]
TTFSFSTTSFFPNLYYLAIFPGVIFYTWAMFRYELLRLSPITYEDILNNLQDNLLVLNHEGFVIQVNDHTTVLFNLGRHELIGRDIDEVLRELLDEEELALLGVVAEARIQGERFKLNTQLQGVVLEIDGLPILENKLPIGQIIICRDVSEASFLKEERDRYLAELEQSQREYLNLVNNVPGMVYELGRRPDGSFFYGYVSDACITLNGVTPDEVYEDPTLLLRRFAEEDLPAIWPRIVQSATDLTPLNGRFWMNINGVKRWREFFSLPHCEEDGTIIWYGIEIDVTEQQAVQETLQHNEEMLRSVITSLDDLIFALDVQGCFVAFYQQASLDTFAPLPEAFAGQHYREVFLPELSTKLDEALQKAAEGDSEADFEYMLTSEADTYEYHARVSRRYGAKGEIAGFTVVVHDITQRANNLRKLAASEQRFRAFVELSPTAVAVASRKGEILLLNERFIELFGYTIDDIPTTDEWFRRAYPDPLYQTQMKQGWGNDVRQMMNTRAARETREYPIMTKSGVLKYVQIAAMPVGEQVVVNFIDVTTERQTEIDLQRAKEAAEAVSEAKSRFLANMSHELRTPLNSILGFAQLIAISDLSPTDRQRIEIINNSGQHLLALINDVLSISKIEAGQERINKVEFDLHETLEQVFSFFVLRAQEKRIAYTLDIDPAVPRYVEGDRVKLRQIALNLISNAVKFTPEGKVSVTAAWQTQPDVALILTVTDTGVGISDEDQKTLFHPFTQTTSGRLAQEGTGLGLALVEKYVELMGGDIIVQSEPGVGTCFTATVLLKATLSQQPDLSYWPNAKRIAPVKLNDGTQPRILIVDDLETNLKLLSSYFKMIQIDTRSAHNGEEALALVETFQPHLIVMDLRMPVMDGYE